jgi:hypothetical protein
MDAEYKLKWIFGKLREGDLLGLNLLAYLEENFLKEQYNNGKINPGSLDEVLKQVIYNQAKKELNYSRRIFGKIPLSEAEHFMGSPKCLAYYLKNANPTNSELNGTYFLEDKSKEYFYKKFGKDNLIEELKEELFNPLKSVEISSCDCDCCDCD